MQASADRTPVRSAATAICSTLALLLLVACPEPPKPATGDAATAPPKDSPKVDAVTAEGDSKPEQAPAQSGVLAAGESQTSFQARADHWFKNNPSQRVYIQVDKPLYQPGETIWVRSSVVASADFAGVGAAGASLQLISPKGSVVLQKRVQQSTGIAATDFELPEGVQGGEYKVRVTSDDGTNAERPIIVSVYEAPRFKKKLDFIRKAYGPGDMVAATVEVKLPTGEPFVARELVGVLTLDGAELPRVKAKTDGKGATIVRVQLPGEIESGDGILTVLVEDAGVTESITKRVPIVLNKIKLDLFPEGGDLVRGLPSRVYFSARNTIDKPADIEGRVVDDNGQTVTTFMSYHDGMGRFALTPAADHSYHIEISKPVGVSQRFQLPRPQQEGCTLRTYDDPKGVEETLRMAVHCTEARKVLVNALLREQRLGTATAEVKPGAPAVVHLPLSQPYKQGIARVTLFTEGMEPLAERLFFRGWHRDLKIKITPDKKNYVPRDKITLNVETKDLEGKPVAADLAMAVVDDTVLSFADDKTAHLLTRMFLESELQGKIEEPNFYFKTDKPKAPLALEMLLGTRGWRRFEWRPVLAEPVPEPTVAQGAGPEGMATGVAAPAEAVAAVAEMEEAEEAPGKLAEAPDMAMANEAKFKGGAKAKPAAAPKPAPEPPRQQAPAPQPVVAAPPADMPIGGKREARRAEAPAEKKKMARRMPAKQDMDRGDRGDRMAVAEEVLAEADDEMIAGEDKDWAGAKEQQAAGKVVAAPEPPMQWAKVRVFPVPTYEPGYDGPRTDFRETIYWNPNVKTDASGKASVTFYLSDAVTSFRVTTEGTAAGLAGHDETVLTSKLPFFMSVKLPLEVSAGDKMELPLTIKNETGRSLKVTLTSSFGEHVKLLENVAPGALDLGSASGRTLSYPLEVIGTLGASEVKFAASAEGLRDEFKRSLKVVPLGFPRSASHSGEIVKKASHDLDLKGALPGSIVATATFYPSPAAEMLSGIESILREPYGCFEQASSSTYPNIMVMQYLQERDVAEPAIVERSSKLLTSGYRRLSGYESPKQGYEWFGGDPGHEALTAYGLMEFVDMTSVYGGVDRGMINRTKKWLLSRRDGKGSFLRNSRALDSFGGANKEVTDAYIVWALTEAKVKSLGRELGAVTATAKGSNDPYVVALAAGSQLNVSAKGGEGMGLVKKLAGMQKPDGRFQGTTHSITRSGGRGLDVETTSLAILALLKSGMHRTQTQKAIKWLMSSRSGSGGFGSTQATILALKAFIAFDRASRRTEAGGDIVVKVNGQALPNMKFAKGLNEPISVEIPGDKLQAGANKVELALKSSASLPYTVSVDYRTNDPDSSPEVPLTLETSIAKERVKMGENIRVTAKLASTSDQGLPMTLIRVGVPGGLSYQTWQLKELVEKKQIAFYETRAREVILYFRALEPKANKEINIDLVANVPGTYTAPASRAYLYYTAEHKAWAPPLKVQVDR